MECPSRKVQEHGKPNLQQGSQGPVFPPRAAPEKAGRAGQAGSGGRRAGQELQNFQSEKSELVLFLPWNCYKGKKRGKKDFITCVRYPKKAFLGCSHRGPWSVSSYSAVWDTMSLHLKWEYLEGLKTSFFSISPISFCLLLLQSCGSDYSFGWIIWKIILLSPSWRCWVKLCMPFHIAVWFQVSRLL